MGGGERRQVIASSAVGLTRGEFVDLRASVCLVFKRTKNRMTQNVFGDPVMLATHFSGFANGEYPSEVKHEEKRQTGRNSHRNKPDFVDTGEEEELKHLPRGETPSSEPHENGKVHFAQYPWERG